MFSNTRHCHTCHAMHCRKCSCLFASMQYAQQLAPNLASYSVVSSLYNVRLIEYICSWVWRSQLGPTADVADHVRKLPWGPNGPYK